MLAAEGREDRGINASASHGWRIEIWRWRAGDSITSGDF